MLYSDTFFNAHWGKAHVFVPVVVPEAQTRVSKQVGDAIGFPFNMICSHTHSDDHLSNISCCGQGHHPSSNNLSGWFSAPQLIPLPLCNKRDIQKDFWR